MRVLFLPHTFRHTYFYSFIKYAVREKGWRVAVVCPMQNRKAYVDAIGPHGKYFFTPDFGRHAEWEDSPVEMEKVHTLMEACEIKTGIGVNRILLAGDRDIGRAYSKEFFYWNESRMAKRVLTSPEKADRVLEREFRFCAHILDAFKPDMVVGGASSAPLYFASSLVAELKGVPFLINRRSKIHSKQCLWTLDRAMLSDLTRDEYCRRESENAPISDDARAYVKRFEKSPETVDYIKNWWQHAAQVKQFWPWHKHIALMVLAQAVHAIKRRKGHPPESAWLKFIEFYRIAYLKLRQRSLMERFTDDQLKGMKYIYLPFHKEPEMAINVQAYPWHSQKETVKFLSSLLPRGYKLLVREHRGTWGRRATAFYKFLKRLPGVTVIDPFDSQFKYIRNADLVITENGSTGWEGLLMRRPTITLHENFYDASGLTHTIGARTELNAKIIELLRHPKPVDWDEYDRRLGWLIDAEWENSLPEDDDHHDKSLVFIDRLIKSVAN
jgi:hypothetical protein